MSIVNLTPHAIVVLVEDPSGEIEGTVQTGPNPTFQRYRKVAEILPAGRVARATQREETVGSVPVNGAEIPVVRMAYGEPTDLPEPQGTMYFVSVLTAQAAAASGRRTDDLLFSGKSVRNRDGRIIGLLSFAQL